MSLSSPDLCGKLQTPSTCQRVSTMHHKHTIASYLLSLPSCAVPLPSSLNGTNIYLVTWAKIWGSHWFSLSISTSNQAPHTADFSSALSGFLLVSIFSTIAMEGTTIIYLFPGPLQLFPKASDLSPVLPPPTHPQNGHQNTLPKASLILIFVWKLSRACFSPNKFQAS